MKKILIGIVLLSANMQAYKKICYVGRAYPPNSTTEIKQQSFNVITKRPFGKKQAHYTVHTDSEQCHVQLSGRDYRALRFFLCSCSTTDLVTDIINRCRNKNSSKKTKIVGLVLDDFVVQDPAVTIGQVCTQLGI